MRARILVAAFVCGGCFKLDPFLYTPGRTDAYEFKPVGATEASTVDLSRIERLFIDVNPEITLGAVLVRANVTPAKGQILFFHGKGGTLDSAFARIKTIANLGYDVLGFDYRGWGMSTNVRPSEPGLDEDSAAVRAWWLQRLPAGAKLVYYGNSFGTAVAAQRAEKDPPAALILDAGFASIEEIQRDSAVVEIPVEFIAEATWATSERISNVHVPLLLLHGTDDTYVRPEFSQRIFDNANEPKTLVMVPGGTHDPLSETMGKQWYAETINGFLAPYL